MKIIQGYEKKNNSSIGMMAEMKKMFEEKLQNMEKENDMLKEKTKKKDKKKITRSEETIVEKGKKHKVNRDDTEFPEDSTESSSKTINNRKRGRHLDQRN